MAKRTGWYVIILILIIVGAFALYLIKPIGYLYPTTTTTATVPTTTTFLVTTSTVSTTTTLVVSASCESACVVLNYSVGTCRPACLGPAEKPAATGNDCLSFQKCCCKK